MLCLKCRQKIMKPSTAKYGLHADCFTQWFCAPIKAEFVSLQRHVNTSSNTKVPVAMQDSSFFRGKFKKYSAKLNDEFYILKMHRAEAAELPEVEYLCNQIGKSLDIPIAQFYFIRFNHDNTFVTKNFIMPGALINLQHLCHFRSSDQHNCEDLIRIIKNETHHPHDISVFIKTVLFDALIGNHDRHGRNLAFMITAKGKSLSPIYDNVSYLGLESGNMLKADFNPAGKIATRNTSEPSMHHYIDEFKRLGYQNEIQSFFHHIKLPLIFQLIDNSFCSMLMKKAFKKLITKRFEELRHALSTETK